LVEKTPNRPEVKKTTISPTPPLPIHPMALIWHNLQNRQRELGRHLALLPHHLQSDCTECGLQAILACRGTYVSHKVQNVADRDDREAAAGIVVIKVLAAVDAADSNGDNDDDPEGAAQLDEDTLLAIALSIRDERFDGYLIAEEDHQVSLLMAWSSKDAREKQGIKEHRDAETAAVMQER
jgi:hypothetical protein